MCLFLGICFCEACYVDGMTSLCVKSMACLVILNAFEWLKTLTKRKPDKRPGKQIID